MLDPEKMEALLIQIMRAERRYANDLKNATSSRRAELREVIEKAATDGLENEA